MDVLVLGGGLAGVEAALELARSGARVTLAERAPLLGGLCRSVTDPVAGRVDTGQHVYLGCCTALEAFLETVGVEPAWRQESLQLVVADQVSGRTRELRAAKLPPPAHLLPVLLRWPGLATRPLVQTWQLAASLRRLSEERQALLDDTPASSWLQSLGQDGGAIASLFQPILVAACNVPLERCSAALAAFVLREGLLRSAQAGALRVPRTDLSGWLDPSCRRALEGAGVEVRLRWRATALRAGPGHSHLVQGADGSEIGAEQLVLAVPPAQAERLLGTRRVRHEPLRAAAGLPSSPIVNVHLFTDRPFLPGPVVVAPRSPLQWLFDRSRLGEGELHLEGERVFHQALSLSAADEEVGVAESALIDRLWPICQELFPAARRSRLRHSRVTRERSATFAALPGSAAARPGPATPLPGVFLAGSFTDTGWPATMESAVRSGAEAARALARAA